MPSYNPTFLQMHFFSNYYYIYLSYYQYVMHVFFVFVVL